MSLSHPLSDTITVIRNGYLRKHPTILLNNSKLINNILFKLKKEGFILDYSVLPENMFKIKVFLKYNNNLAVLNTIEIISTPGSRKYSNYKNLFSFLKTSYDILLISTSKGILTHKEALSLQIGGEVLLRVF
uniref:30S ribosomal protein S8 n=1 Tax=Palpitomonas bilix TaxID=652834 RepID=A0A1E1GHT2_9EUKA|nr:30S ribosomal protein S8 [Palpitomonas bilix]BAV82417.1 30S ribosomal protein S8 [Palpitomonas bilix]